MCGGGELACNIQYLPQTMLVTFHPHQAAPEFPPIMMGGRTLKEAPSLERLSIPQVEL